jgi:hypothetical protein
VARQYSGTLGNCQIAISVHAAPDEAAAPLDWQLFLPESWDDQSTTDPYAIAAITVRRRVGDPLFAVHHRPQVRNGDRADRVGPDPAGPAPALCCDPNPHPTAST